MLRRLALTIGVVAALAAQAANVGIPYTLTANGTTKATTPLTNVAASDTNFVNLAAMFVTVPANSTGTVEIATHILGSTATPAYSVQLINDTATASVRFLMPRKAVTSVSTPEVAMLPLYGTNALLSVTKSGPATNSWAITLCVEQ